ncbi:MAG: tRNA (adenosine(37)-N6)-dimethylallyltransferase MiaA [Planctomycetes bacterium]|nr:tRNA (adenosine(37)-N6)-dimethylallyltransferase MiaA [Planctomycetota bacterium]
MNVSTTPLPVLAGPTAIGKSGLAVAVARRAGARILSIDSMLVYRGLDIGTDKPAADLLREVPHDLVDIRSPGETFSAAEFLDEADAALARASARGERVLAVCGTPLYLRAYRDGLFEGPSADAVLRESLEAEGEASGWSRLHDRLKGADAAAASRIHPNDARRIVRALEVIERTGRPVSEQRTQWASGPARPVRMVVLTCPRDVLNRRIDERIDRMMGRGLLDEVRALAQGPLARGPRQAIGYKEMLLHLEGGCSLEDAVARIRRATRNLAKQQRTWLKRFGAEGTIDLGDLPSDSPKVVGEALRLLGWERSGC